MITVNREIKVPIYQVLHKAMKLSYIIAHQTEALVLLQSQSSSSPKDATFGHFSEFLLFLTEGYIVMKKICQGTNGEFGLVIRQGTCQDMDDLTTICHLCYPDLLRWRGPRFHTKKWWQALLDAEYCELWVCLSRGQVIGYTAFLLDKAQFVEAWSKHRPGLLAAFYMLATCPRLFIRKALQKLKLKGIKSMLKFVRSPSNGDERQAFEGSKRLSDRQILWVGPTAVVPSMQGHGVGTEMVKFCFQRAIELGYREIGAWVLRSNTRSIGLFKKLGFAMTPEGQGYLTFRKTLT